MLLFDWLRYFVRAWWPGLLVLLALIALAAAYLSSALRSRGRPAVERRGAGLAGGFGGFGPMSRRFPRRKGRSPQTLTQPLPERRPRDV